MRSVLGRADVQDLPLEVVLERLEAFEGDLEGEWGQELGGVVQDRLLDELFVVRCLSRESVVCCRVDEC